MVRKISDVMTSFRPPDVFNFKSMNERYVWVLIERTTDVKSPDREECHHAPYTPIALLSEETISQDDGKAIIVSDRM